MNNNTKSLGVRLINFSTVIFLSLQFGILPILTIIALVVNFYPEDFLQRFLYSLGLVYVLGGFLCTSVKLWELWDDKFIDLMKTKWRSKEVMRRVYYKLVIPKNFKRPPEDMNRLFYDLHPMNGGLRTKYERYNQGKDYYPLIFDIIVRGGKVEMYMSFSFKRQDMVFKSMNLRFPEIKLVETVDPFLNWPKKWKPGVGVPGYKDFHGHNYGFADQDVFPLADPSGLGENSPPLGELLESFKNYDPKATIVLQYVLCSFENIHVGRWLKELESIKSDFLEKSTRINMGDSTTAAVGDMPETLKKLVDRLENRVRDYQYLANLKFLVFYPEGKSYYGPVTEKFMKGYASLIEGRNGITKDWYSATDRFFLATHFGLWDGIIGPIMDRIYHRKEVIFRRKVLYQGLLARRDKVSHQSTDFMLDVPSLSSLLHFPGGVGIFENLGTPNQVVEPGGQVDGNQNSSPNSFQKLKELREKVAVGANTELDALKVNK